MGYDAGKRVKGCKIHALVDSEGSPIRVVVHSAAIQDRDGAELSSTVVLRRRWVVAHLFLVGRNRRLAKDFENLASTLRR